MMVRKENIVTAVATCWEVLVVVLVTFSAFSLAKFSISPLFLRDWLCWVALMMVARLPKPKTLILLNLSFDYIMILQPEQHQCQWLRHRPGFLCCRPVFWVRHLPVWLTSPVAGCCFCCRSYMSLTMTYPSRVCSASSFLFSSRSSGTRRRSGGPQPPIMRVPHRQSLLPVRLRTPAPLNRNARWRSQPT